MEMHPTSTDKLPRAQKESIGSYCVWTKLGRKPFFYHPTLAGAEAEAARLAALHPGKKFLVMKMEAKYHVPAAELPTKDEITMGELVDA